MTSKILLAIQALLVWNYMVINIHGPTEEKGTLCKFHSILTNDDKHWKQKSRVTRLQGDDHNTHFSKLTTFKQMSTNKIHEIKNKHGNLTQDPMKIYAAQISFFQKLSLEEEVDEKNMEDVLEHIPYLIT